MDKKDITIAGKTHIGMQRKDNQDSYGFFEPGDEEKFLKKGRLFIVADGLGGHRGGKVASSMAVDIVGREYYACEYDDIYKSLISAIEKANREIYEKGKSDEALERMGTTCTTVVIRQPYLYLAHVGDSRAYIIRDNIIKQISTDHTLVEEMVNSGIINKKDAKNHPDSHILTRSLGIHSEVEIDILDPPIKLEDGDVILICSDGLTVYLSDEEIKKIVKKHSPEEACEKLIDIANSRGGRDNITVEIIKINDALNGAILGDTAPFDNKTKKLEQIEDIDAVYGKRGKEKSDEFDEEFKNGDLIWPIIVYLIIGFVMWLYFFRT